MLNIGIIGIGNAGNQVAALAANEMGIDAICINSSEKDLGMVGGKAKKILIGDSKGAGKNRDEAKAFIKENLKSICNSEEIDQFFKSADGVNKDFVFIVSSTGGGTGSGSAPMFADIMRALRPNTNFILIGIMPSISEAFSAQVNTCEYFKELYSACTDIPYMVYDNEKMSDKPINVMMDTINKAIVDDLKVIRGDYQFPTKYCSIDEKDATSILTTTGRIVIAGARDIRQKQLDKKTIGQFIVDDLKENCHAEMNRDKKVHRLGIISYLDADVNEKFDGQLQDVQEFIGTPIETFTHFAIKGEDVSEIPNVIYLIASGLSRIDDRIERVAARVQEIQDAQEKLKAHQDSLEGIDISALNAKKEIRKKSETAADAKVDVSNIFAKFGC